MPRLSIIAVTANDEERLSGFLDAVRSVASEIVVVDGGSTDGTVARARAFGAKVVHAPGLALRDQKALGLAEATGEYVLELQPSERMGKSLLSAVCRELDRPGGPRCAGYRIRLRFGQRRASRPIRLYRREGARHDGEPTAPGIATQGPIGYLPGRLITGRPGSRAMPLRRGFWHAVAVVASALLPRAKNRLPSLAEVRKVLVIRVDERVGNQLLTTPLLRALKRGLPAAEIHFLAAARKQAVLPGRVVDRVIPFEKRSAFRAPWKLVALVLALRRERYDLVFESGHFDGASITGLLLARAVGGRVLIGHDRQGSHRFLSHPVKHDCANRVEVQARLELLRPLGLPPQGLEPETSLGEDTGPARALLERLGLGPGVALLFPGARISERRWLPEAFAAVVRGLRDRGLRVLVVWGPGEERLAQAIVEGTDAVLAPATDLKLLAGLLRLTRICISNNTGPMHLSVAVGTPTVGVFIFGDAVRWGHPLPIFEVAEPGEPHDSAAVLAACDRLLARTERRPAGLRETPGRNPEASPAP